MHDSLLTTGQKGPRLYLTRDKCPPRLCRLDSAISHIKAEENQCGLEQKHGLGTFKKLWMFGELIDRQMAVRCLRFLKTSMEIKVNGEVELNEDISSLRVEMADSVLLKTPPETHILIIYLLITQMCEIISELETEKVVIDISL